MHDGSPGSWLPTNSFRQRLFLAMSEMDSVNLYTGLCAIWNKVLDCLNDPQQGFDFQLGNTEDYGFLLIYQDW